MVIWLATLFLYILTYASSAPHVIRFDDWYRYSTSKIRKIWDNHPAMNEHLTRMLDRFKDFPFHPFTLSVMRDRTNEDDQCFDIMLNYPLADEDGYCQIFDAGRMPPTVPFDFAPRTFLLPIIVLDGKDRFKQILNEGWPIHYEISLEEQLLEPKVRRCLEYIATNGFDRNCFEFLQTEIHSWNDADQIEIAFWNLKILNQVLRVIEDDWLIDLLVVNTLQAYHPPSYNIYLLRNLYDFIRTTSCFASLRALSMLHFKRAIISCPSCSALDLWRSAWWIALNNHDYGQNHLTIPIPDKMLKNMAKRMQASDIRSDMEYILRSTVIRMAYNKNDLRCIDQIEKEKERPVIICSIALLYQHGHLPLRFCGNTRFLQLFLPSGLFSDADIDGLFQESTGSPIKINL